MLGKLLLALILIPIAEFFVLVWVADQTSVVTAILLVIVAGIGGLLVVRQQGLRVWRQFRRSMAEGNLPSRELRDGLVIIAAGLLLLTPGLITDVLGFLLLIPKTRGWARRWLSRHFSAGMWIHTTVHPQHPARPNRSQTIDATDVRRVS